jgi:hypothetical protein
MYFYTSAEVDILDLIDCYLSDTKRKALTDYLLCQTLQAERLETETKKPRPNLLIDLDDLEVDIDVYDVYRDMNSWDKRELADMLERDGYMGDIDLEEKPTTPEEIFAEGTRPLEQEFGLVLNQLWESRDYLSQEQKNRIEAIIKESYV